MAASSKKKPHQESLTFFPVQDVSFVEEAEKRYLNYALSVITSRALPDVRDGLKPVQRRILYAMFHDLHLSPDAKYRKSAAVVGDVMGKYHPHGDVAIYDAMVRLAQDFSMRNLLVDGHGNFGSADGDSAAAMRYTEAKLRPLAIEMLGELGRRTVSWRANYDGTRFEPIVLPSRFPNLLVNGSQGIAVGMATSIPPHHLGEVIDACLAWIENPQIETKQLLKYIKGPDFPTAGEMVASKSELEAIYTSGQGTFKLRGEWELESTDKKNSKIVISSIPYSIERKTVVEKIADVILSKKLPQLIDVRDESTEITRIVLELKKETDPELVIAYLYKHTPLSTSVAVNLTCLIPTELPEIATPKRLQLSEMIEAFLQFRFATVSKRLEFDLEEINKRIHLLQGFEKIFDALDEVIRIIRKSDGKADAAKKLIARFDLLEDQVEAILELKLYRLAKLEILLIQKDLEAKQKEAKRLNSILKSDTKRWDLIKDELNELKAKFSDKRRTKVISLTKETQFEAEDFIIAEDTTVILSSQGWIKRVKEVKDLSATRLREGDSVLAVSAGSTKASIAFFSNFGVCYVCRIAEIQASTGYGDPIQKLFKLSDGERILGMQSFDPRFIDENESMDGMAGPFAVAITRSGLGFRFSLQSHFEPSTRVGRKFAKLNEGDEIVLIQKVEGSQIVAMISSDGHALSFPCEQLTLLSGAGKGVIGMKLNENECILFAQVLEKKDELRVETEKGKVIRTKVIDILGSRAGKGYLVALKRDQLTHLILPELEVPNLSGKQSP